MRSLIIYLNFLGFLFSGVSVFSQNNALDFDGDGDYIVLTPLNGLPTSGVSEFTVELQFISTETSNTAGTCANDFRRLFALGDPTNTTLFEVGECNGFLSVVWYNSSGFSLLQMTTSIRDGQWHCLSVVRSANNLEIYLDGNLVLVDGTVVGTHNISTFVVGHGLALLLPNPSPGEDWKGGIDEVKLWSVALLPTELTACSGCQCTGFEPNLIAFWQFDQGVAGQNNSTTGTNITQVTDGTPNNNNGAFHPLVGPPDPGFDLMGSDGNFITSGASIVYPSYNDLTLFISDPQLTVGLAAICDNKPVYFTLADPNGNIPVASSGVSTTWQYRDVGGSPLWTTTTLTGFQFVVPSGEATLITCPYTNGNVIREYRAIISATNQFGTCMDTTPSIPLQIYCKVTQADVQLISTPPGPLCEGDMVTFNVSVTSNVYPNFGNDVHINWCIIESGVATQLPAYDDLPSFTYPPIGNYTAISPDVCFKAIVSNGACPSLTGQDCIQVDLNPVCGYIVACPNPTNLTFIGFSPWPIYEICPGNDAMVCLNMNPVLPPLFANCIPQWEYSFPPLFNWTPLGFSNSVQNTNILPAHFTPPWPSGTTSIFYRVKCFPLSSPSGCDPCLSQNIIEIRLKPVLAKPIITIDNPKICDYGFATVSVTNVDPLVSLYTWYCNGEIIGYGNNIGVNKDACYWVEATDGCSTVKSEKVCLKVCIATAVISCPQDNPCAIPNVPITLCAYDSFSNCGPIVSWVWGWDSGTYVTGQGTPCLTHIPALNGTTYTLTVTDACGCMHTTQGFIKPCQP